MKAAVLRNQIFALRARLQGGILNKKPIPARHLVPWQRAGALCAPAFTEKEIALMISYEKSVW